MSDSDPIPEPAVRELIAAGEKATPGPWEALTVGDGYEREMVHYVEGPEHFGFGGNDMNYVVRRDGSNGVSTFDNAAFIALSRNLAPSLARDWLALRERVKVVEAERDAALRRSALNHAEATAERVRAEKIEAERDAAVARAEKAEANHEELFRTATEKYARLADSLTTEREKVAGLEVDRDSWRRKYEALRARVRRSVDEGLNSGEGAYKP